MKLLTISMRARLLRNGHLSAASGRGGLRGHKESQLALPPFSVESAVSMRCAGRFIATRMRNG